MTTQENVKSDTMQGKFVQVEINWWLTSADAAPDHCGEEGADPEGKALNFPVHLRSFLYL